MAIKPVAQLKSQAQLIKNETTPSANTATRIGQELLDVVDTFAAEITGHPPYIGEDGLWYQWDMELSQYASTQVEAKGDTGPQGPQGPKGATGATGDKGDTGNAGVAVSDEAPTDTDVKVWLKPDGEAPEFATKEYVDNIVQMWYGIEFDTAIPSPTCTRIGNMSLHRTLPIHNAMRGCILDDNGAVVEYLTPTNWRAHDLSGASGQVMVEIPAHYRKFVTSGTKRQVRISECALTGYHFVPKMYVSAYEAVLQRSNGKLCSVVNMGADYRGGANQTDWDGTYRTVLGRPVTGISRTAFRNAARARGAGSQWNCNDYNSYKAIFWLYYVEYANRNSQTPFNAAKDANGCAQGGLGDGVTTLPRTQWYGFNGYYPFVPCGHTDTLGNMSGEVAYTMQNADNSTLATVYANRYRGIENPFGHVWKWTDGINIEVKTDADGGTSKVYVCTDPAQFKDNGYTGYELRGLEARTEGYVRELVFGEFGDIIPSVVGGGTTTYWADYHWCAVASSSLRGVLFGGHAYRGKSAGFGSTLSSDVPSQAHMPFGSRLCFIPA